MKAVKIKSTDNIFVAEIASNNILREFNSETQNKKFKDLNIRTNDYIVGYKLY